MNSDKNKPIGIFDSGIGGLTVAKAITNELPHENFVYIGDTARVPYGSRGKEIITEYALQLTQFLLKQDIKFLVVACNTVSATCLDEIREISPVPVLGVIEPAVNKIIHTTQNNRVGIIGTRATISSKAYEEIVRESNPAIHVFSQSCPLFVPIVEEGLADSDIAELTAQKYLSGLKSSEIDTLHLGCTHYPLLKKTIQKIVGENVAIIDSAHPTAEELKRILTNHGLLNDIEHPNYEFYVTDDPERASHTAQLFFGENIIGKIHKVDINDLQALIYS